MRARLSDLRRNQREIGTTAYLVEIVVLGGFVRKFGQISKNGVRPPSYHLLVTFKYLRWVFVMDVTRGLFVYHSKLA